MIVKPAITGPAGSGKTTHLYRLRREAEAAGLKVLEVSALDIHRSSLEALIERAGPDVLLIDEFDALDCRWHPTDLVGPAATVVYYTQTTA